MSIKPSYMSNRALLWRHNRDRWALPSRPRSFVRLSNTQRSKTGCPTWRVGEHPSCETAPVPMCFTEEALEELLRTVGSRPPETGAKAFGPKDALGIDLVEFDDSGSSRAGGAIYAPDVIWSDERRAFHLSRPDDEVRLWTGDIHSHPGWLGRPSGRAGRGLGDLGYVEEVFASDETAEWFLLPILTGTGTDEVVIHPWVCRRGEPLSLYIAELQICEVSEFPEREFNPQWIVTVELSGQDGEDVDGDENDDEEPERDDGKAAPLELAGWCRRERCERGAAAPSMVSALLLVALIMAVLAFGAALFSAGLSVGLAVERGSFSDAEATPSRRHQHAIEPRAVHVRRPETVEKLDYGVLNAP
jgi:hypothetical protein